MLNNCEAKGLGCVLTLPIYRGREQHGNGRETGDKGTGSGRVRYGRREVLTPLSPPTRYFKVKTFEGLHCLYKVCVKLQHIGCIGMLKGRSCIASTQRGLWMCLSSHYKVSKTTGKHSTTSWNSAHRCPSIEASFNCLSLEIFHLGNTTKNS